MPQLPTEFVNYTQQLFGTERWHGFLHEMECPSRAFVRLNADKLSPTSTVSQPLCTVEWASRSYGLAHRHPFTFDPLFHTGTYYVQEQSSMFLETVLRQIADHPVTMIDMCAAPGGKSTLALGALPKGSVIISNEPVRLRAQILAENIAKWGHPLSIVTNAYPRDMVRSGIKADIVLTDVPCSGEGMFRKDENAIGEWSVQNVKSCSELQRSIVTDAWRCLRPGGYYIYSTCTYNTRENEENILWMCRELGAEPVSIHTEAQWNIMGSLLDTLDAPVYRFIPGVSGCSRTADRNGTPVYGEGLFMAVLRKTGEPTAMSQMQKPRNQKKKSAQPSIPSHLQQWITDTHAYHLVQHESHLLALPNELLSLYEQLAAAKVHMLSAGICMAELKGHDWIPQQQLALSTALSENAFPQVELNWEDAIRLLRREAVNLPDQTPRGYCLATHRNMPLAFLKHLGNRTNNIYPQEWKIRSGHLPDHFEPLISF